MKKTTLILGIFLLVVVLTLVRLRLVKSEGFFAMTPVANSVNCTNQQVTYKYGNQKYCLDVGDYADLSSTSTSLRSCTVTTPPGLKLQAYYLQNFVSPTWSVNPGKTRTLNCYPYSIKVSKV